MQIRMNLKTKLLFTLVLGFSFSKCFGQIEEKINKPSYFSFQTGAMMDSYNSFGVRAFFEYQKDLKKNWQYGISLEQKIHLFRAATDHPNSLATNLSLISYNHYYKLKLYKDRVFWTCGLGAGIGYVYFKDYHKVGVTANASITLNIRVTKKLFIETSSLLVLLPFNRGYYSPMNVSTYPNLWAGTFFPIGFKVRL